MNYRKIGKSGVLVSEIGIGCEGLINKTEDEVLKFIDLMEKKGANIIDLYSPNPDLRRNLAFALKGMREKFILQSHLCSVWQKGQYKRTRNIEEVKTGFEDMLVELNTNYIDIGMIHYCDSDKDLDDILSGPIIKFALDMKEEGRIKMLGLSSHNPLVAMKAVATGLFDVLMFSVNPCYDMLPANEDVEQLWNPENYKEKLLNMDSNRQKLYETCEKLQVGITVMKAFGGGDMLNSEYSPAKVALTPIQCIHYALSRPAVVSVMCGAKTMDEYMECLRYEEAKDSEKDYAKTLATFPKISWEGHCMYCGHCAPCPKYIDIALTTKFLNLTKAQNMVPETVMEHYRAMPHKASECIQCGACEKRCPFKVEIRKNMKEAQNVFGE